MQQIATLLILLVLGTPVYAQWFDWQSPNVPRTADGKPDMNAPVPRTADGRVDMSGLWVPKDAHGTLFETSKIRGWALDAMTRAENNYYRDDPRFNCLPSGPSSYIAGISVGGMRRMVQHPDRIVVLNGDMTYRQILMDGRKLEPDPLLPTWMGYSIGYWDGDTLVVESNGYNERTWLTREGLPHTDKLRITERYTRLDYGHIKLEINYIDPGIFTEPVQASVDLVNRADGSMQEVICNESETGRKHYSGKVSQAEAKQVEVPLATLQSYVGTYRGPWLGNPVTAEVTLKDGQLFLTRTPRYSDTGGNTNYDTSPLIPQSETAFDSNFGLGWIFNIDANGKVVSVSEVHVSGAWPLQRVE